MFMLTVHLSIFILVINQLDAQNFCFTVSLFHASTCFTISLFHASACFTISLFHASACFEHHMLIIRKSKLYYTASGIITPIGVMIPEAV